MSDLDHAKRAAIMLDRVLLGFGPDVARASASGTERYQRAGRLFAILRPMATRMDVGFFKLGRARSKRILHARGKLPFVPYRVEVEAPGDVDSELIAWLRESYDLAGE